VKLGYNGQEPSAEPQGGLQFLDLVTILGNGAILAHLQPLLQLRVSRAVVEVVFVAFRRFVYPLFPIFAQSVLAITAPLCDRSLVSSKVISRVLFGLGTYFANVILVAIRIESMFAALCFLVSLRSTVGCTEAHSA